MVYVLSPRCTVVLDQTRVLGPSTTKWPQPLGSTPKTEAAPFHRAGEPLVSADQNATFTLGLDHPITPSDTGIETTNPHLSSAGHHRSADDTTTGCRREH